MGWDFTHREKGVSNADWFAQEFPSMEFLATSTVGGAFKGVFYAAARKKPELCSADDDAGQVFALVFLTQWVPNDYFNFGYKAMDETVGPCEDAAPKKILDLLTPLAPEDADPTVDMNWAAQWRARAWANIEAKAARPKVKKGDKVKFAKVIEFTNGFKSDTFVFVERNTFRAMDGYGRYRLTGWRDMAYEVVAPSAVSV